MLAHRDPKIAHLLGHPEHQQYKQVHRAGVLFRPPEHRHEMLSLQFGVVGSRGCEVCQGGSYGLAAGVCAGVYQGERGRDFGVDQQCAHGGELPQYIEGGC